MLLTDHAAADNRALYICSQILVGNKCDIDESKRAVPYSKGQALANEFGIKFFETSAKSNINVEEVCTIHWQARVSLQFWWHAGDARAAAAIACTTLWHLVLQPELQYLLLT